MSCEGRDTYETVVDCRLAALSRAAKNDHRAPNLNDNVGLSTVVHTQDQGEEGGQLNGRDQPR